MQSRALSLPLIQDLLIPKRGPHAPGVYREGLALRPRLAMANIFEDPRENLAFARDCGFDGIDWSLRPEDLPANPAQESAWVERFRALTSMETRYHCAFPRLDIGHQETAEAGAAMEAFQKAIRLVSKMGGRYLTLHIGLGRDSTLPLSWGPTVENLEGLVRLGLRCRVTVCVENLAWGWTSRPNLFEKLVRRSGAGVTLDIGHALVSEVVQTRVYGIEDFVSPHPERLFNAHVYHEEHPVLGHLPPASLGDIEGRLRVLVGTGCPWWVMELREERGMLRTKAMVEAFLEAQREDLPLPTPGTGAAYNPR